MANIRPMFSMVNPEDSHSEPHNPNKGWGNRFVASFGMMDSDTRAEREAGFRHASAMLRESGGSFREILENSLRPSDEVLQQYIDTNKALGEECQQKSLYINQLEQRIDRTRFIPRIRRAAAEILKPNLINANNLVPVAASAGTYLATGNTELTFTVGTFSGYASALVSWLLNRHSEAIDKCFMMTTIQMVGFALAVASPLFKSDDDYKKEYIQKLSSRDDLGPETRIDLRWPTRFGWYVTTVAGKSDSLDYVVDGQKLTHECRNYWAVVQKHVPDDKLHDPQLRVIDFKRPPDWSTGDCKFIQEYREAHGMSAASVSDTRPTL